ncbi:MAG: hypothetical protein M3460_15755 [Actinomycetota bacterium]|nr:hypothetical protein [Actinomycetota bacterium]
MWAQLLRRQAGVQELWAGLLRVRGSLMVTVTNGTAKPLDLIAVSIQATAGEQEAGQVYDSAKDITGVSSQTLAPGKRQTFG